MCTCVYRIPQQFQFGLRRGRWMPRTTRTSGRKRCSARRGSNTPSRPGKSQWRSVSFDIEYILKYMIINVWINWINYNSILFNVWINNITIQRNLNIWTWFWNLLECFGTFFFRLGRWHRNAPLCPVVSLWPVQAAQAQAVDSKHLAIDSPGFLGGLLVRWIHGYPLAIHVVLCCYPMRKPHALPWIPHKKLP